MTNISADRLNQIAALADALPEKYQVAAFQEMVRHEMGDGKSVVPPDRREPAEELSNDEVDAPSERHDWFSELVEQMPDRDQFAEGGRDAQAAWALVELRERGEPATVASVRELIKVELGETPELRQHLSNRLGRDFTPRYADRIQHEGNAYRYEPTRRIVEKFPTSQGAE